MIRGIYNPDGVHPDRSFIFAAFLPFQTDPCLFGESLPLQLFPHMLWNDLYMGCAAPADVSSTPHWYCVKYTQVDETSTPQFGESEITVEVCSEYLHCSVREIYRQGAVMNHSQFQIHAYRERTEYHVSGKLVASLYPDGSIETPCLDFLAPQLQQRLATIESPLELPDIKMEAGVWRLKTTFWEGSQVRLFLAQRGDARVLKALSETCARLDIPYMVTDNGVEFL